MSILSATVLLFLIMNPLGNLPFFLHTLRPINPKRHNFIIIRETCFAYLLLLTFMFFGQAFLDSVRITQQALGISGGIILFIIAIRMIFPERHSTIDASSKVEPFFVPLAIPMTAGPGTITTVMLFSTQQPEQKLTWVIAVTIASIAVGSILLSGHYLSKFLGNKGLIALEKLSGMLLTAIAVQILLSAIQSYFKL